MFARIVLLSVAVSTACAACGGNGDGQNNGNGEATPTVTVTTVTATEPSTDTTSMSEEDARRLAESMLLDLDDFPTGWRADEPEDDEGCAGIERLRDRYDVLARAESKDFSHGETEAASDAHIFVDQSTSQDAFEYVETSIQDQAFLNCINDALSEQEEEGLTFGDVRVGQVSFPDLGDRSSAWEVVVPIEQEGASTTAYVDLVLIQRSNALSIVMFGEVFAPFDEQMREKLAEAVAARMDAAVETP